MLLVVTPETNKFVGVHSEGAFTLSVVPEDTILLKCWMKLGVLVIVESVSLFFSHSVESAHGCSVLIVCCRCSTHTLFAWELSLARRDPDLWDGTRWRTIMARRRVFGLKAMFCNALLYSEYSQKTQHLLHQKLLCSL